MQEIKTQSAITKTLVIGLAMFLLPLFSYAQTKPMPIIHGKTLDGNTVSLPAASGKPVVLVFGFAHSAKDEGESWGKELIAIRRERNDFDFFQVATLSGAPRFTYGLITRAIRSSVPSAYYPHMLLLTESDKVWRDLLDVTDEGSAYVVLCSPTGEVQWRSRGAGEAQFSALRAELRKDDAGHGLPLGGSDVNH